MRQARQSSVNPSGPDPSPAGGLGVEVGCGVGPGVSVSNGRAPVEATTS